METKLTPAQYEIRWSEESDGLALYCPNPDCRERVCDVEHDDTLHALLATAAAHECGREHCECSDPETATMLHQHGHACPLYNETE